MDPVTGALIAGAASTGGSIVGSAATGRSLSRQMAFQTRQADLARQEARTAREWAAGLSSTEMQRRVADLRAAGLNPAMAMESGRGASTPSATISGAAPQGSHAVYPDPITPGVSSAMGAARLATDVRQAEAILNRTEAETVKIATDAATSIEHAEFMRAQRRSIDQGIQFTAAAQPYKLRSSSAEALLSEYLISGARNESDWNEMLGILRPAIGSVTSSASGVARILGGLRGGIRPRFGVNLPPVRLKGPYEPR